MAKIDKYRLKIIKNLEKSSHNIKELNKLVNKDIGNVNINKRNNSFNEAIISLLNDGTVFFKRYDLTVHETKEKRKDGSPRIQSIKPDGIVISLVKNDEFYIQKLLDDVTTGNRIEVKNELNCLFRKKYDEYLEYEDNFNKQLLNFVKCEPLKEVYEGKKKEIHKKANEAFDKYKKTYPNSKWLDIQSLMEDEDYIEGCSAGELKEVLELRGYKRELSYLEQEFHPDKINDDSKMYFLDGLPFNITQEIWTKLEIDPFYDPDFINRLLKEGFSKMDFLGELTPESYIKQLCLTNYHDEDQLNTLLDNILFYIDAHDNYKKLKKHFAYSLSNKEGSINFFRLFLSIVTLADPYTLLIGDKLKDLYKI